MPRQRYELQITADNLWFLERYLSVFEFFDLFPPDAISAENTRGVSIRFQTDLDFVIETDIDRAKMQLRNRSKVHGWTRFTSEHGLKIGDTIIIERIADRTYSLKLEHPLR